jgi:hypothetical protein
MTLFNIRLNIIPITLLVLVTASCSTAKHASSNNLPGVWQLQQITIDGSNKDWPAPYPFYDGKAKIGYAYSNDKDYLYLTIETGDEMTQMKILRAGLTVYIDTTGKKSQLISIRFPLNTDNESTPVQQHQGKQNADNNSDLQQSRQKSTKERINNMLNEANQMYLDGFYGCNGPILIKQDNNCGIVVRTAIDEFGDLVWEAAIPFKAVYGRQELSKSDIGKAVSVCFAIKGFKKPASSGGEGGHGSGGMGGGMHGGGMGGMHGSGGRPGNSANTREQLFESTKTWKQFGLAYKQ